MNTHNRDQSATELKVLLVDDDQEALEELKEIVELEGWEAETATSVEVAIELLEDDPKIAVIVSDYYFALEDGLGSNGVQFASRALARFPDRKLPFIILSGDPDVLKSSLQVGAFKFLNKPLLVDDFIHAIKTASASSQFESDCVSLSKRMIAI